MTKEPFASSLKLSVRIKAHALANGLICYPDTGTADGINGDHILLAPPYIVSKAEIMKIVDKLNIAINLAIEEVKSCI